MTIRPRVRRTRVPCATCGVVFLPGYNASRRAAQGLPVYHARACYVRLSNAKRWQDVVPVPVATCAWCQQDFVPSQGQQTRVRQGHAVYCCKAHVTAWHSQVMRGKTWKRAW